jgi:hypothetical protein
MDDGRQLRVVGGANVPTRNARINATWPLAVLTVVGDAVRLSLRGPGRVIARPLGAQSLHATPVDVPRVFPVAGFTASGVGFRTRDGREFFFWTRNGPVVLDRLRLAGYTVSDVPEKPSRAWRGLP